MKALRNIGIIVALATIKDVVPGGGDAATFIITLISLAFLGAIAWVASRLYREHRVAIYSLGDRNRAIVYIAVGVAAVTLTASGRLLNTSLGSVAWLLLLAVAVVAVIQVIRSSREY